MIGMSKFDYGAFYGYDEQYFAVSKQRYTLAEANALFKQEIEPDESDNITISDAAVRWRAGYDEDGERQVCWWLELDKDGKEPRCCPVWCWEW